MITITTLKLITPYVRTFESAADTVAYLVSIGYLDYQDGLLCKADGMKVLETDGFDDHALIGIPQEGRIHKVEWESPEEKEELNAYMKEAGLT